jgi:cyanophycinase
MAGVFLIGGGRDDDAAVRAAHAPFVQATEGGSVLCLATEDLPRWEGNLRLAGAEDVRPLLVTEMRPDALDGVAGVYVGGGLTPAYLEALRGLEMPAGVPYAGFSAGAAIAAAKAIVGGWRIGDRQVCDEDFSEDLEQVVAEDGLGLVPFAVDVHATQWGTVSRAINAVERGLYDGALAVDEHCCVEVRDGEVAAVHGRGVAYRIRPGVEIEILSP